MMQVIGTIFGLLGAWLFLCDKRNEFAMILMAIGLVVMGIGGAGRNVYPLALDTDPVATGARFPIDVGEMNCIHGWTIATRCAGGAAEALIPIVEAGPVVIMREGAVLDGPNRDGRTLVWPTWADGKRTVRCFMPGSMS